MLFAIFGLFKEGAHERISEVADELNEYLGQQFQQPQLAGALIDEHGRRIGNMLFLEADGFERANAHVARSPYVRGDFYERVVVAHYQVEVGRFESS